MKKILFITHDATLTGAPLVLLHFIEWMKHYHSDEWERHILFLEGGFLEERFQVATQQSFKPQPKRKSRFQKVVTKIFRQNVTVDAEFWDGIAEQGYDIIYANTAKSLKRGAELKNMSAGNPKLIAHIHEMQTVLKRIGVAEDVKENIDRYIAVSDKVRSTLSRHWGVKKKNLDVVYEFSKVAKMEAEKVKKESTWFVVGASGLVNWRKGPELFVQVARYIRDHYPSKKILFQWIGKISDDDRLIIQDDLEKLNLQETVRFEGQIEHPHTYYSTFDVFLMTSREDPFPLVCIEVGMMGTPILCFDQATGTQEVIVNGGGKVVPYLNIEKMAEAIVAYYDTPSLLKEDSKLAKDAFSKFTPELQCPKIMSIIDEVVR